MDHEFPGVAECIPAGAPRDAFVNGLGTSLMEAGLADSNEPGDSFRYDGQVAGIRRVLDEPEMRRKLEECRASGGGGGAGGSSSSGMPSLGTVLAATAIILAVSAMLWWAVRGGTIGASSEAEAASGPPAARAATRRTLTASAGSAERSLARAGR